MLPLCRFLCFVLEICNDVTPSDTYSVQAPFGGVTDWYQEPSDTPDSPPSQDPYETIVAQWRSRVAARSSPPSSPIRQILPAPPGLPRRPAVLSVGSLPTHRLASRYLSDSSSSDSSLRHYSLGYAISDTPCDSPTATFKRPSRKRCRSPAVPVSSPVREALSPVHTDLSPPPKRIRDFDSVTDLEVSSEDGYEPYVPREVGLRVDVEDSYEPYTKPDIDSDIQADIDECITYADAIRDRGMDDRDVVETAAKEEVESRERDVDGAVEVTYETLGGLVHRFHDHAMEILVHRIQVIESEQRLQGHRITGVDLEVTTMTERIDTLELDNTRLRGMLDVESQRVDRLQRDLSPSQRELRQMRRFRFYDRVRLGRLEACARRHLGYRH
ncbi:hypothetical protein Tco_1265277 [Tanacetum coccineum]